MEVLLRNFIKQLKDKLETNPPAVLTMGFFLIITVGSILLFLPFSSKNLNFTNFLDCVFISTSSVCVTGLSTINITNEFNYFGKTVIMLLIQAGGLGFMTMATMVAMILGEKITLKDRLVIQEQMGSTKLSGMVKLIRYVIFSTLLIEGVGAFLMSFVFIPKFGIKGIFYSVFHAISAFCNAGFDILGENSLEMFNATPYMLFVVSALIILGGLGFNVYIDINNSKFKFNKYSLHTKIVLVMTLGLVILGTFMFFVLEYSNVNTLKNLNFFDKISNAFFQSVTTRTAGFYSINQTYFTESSTIFTIFLMFIGGSPASTAGGIKTTTIFLLIVTTISFIKNNDEIEVFKRRISFSLVKRAIGIFVISLLLVGTVVFTLTLIEDVDFINLLFETVSAFATVGLSKDLTPHLKDITKVFIIILMFIGRVGPLTIIFSFYNKVNKKKFKYSNGNVIVG
ncbi:potassium uptake protein, TrkH family [Parvimonas sp. KA00067]|nr:potassium uptake protein, TrkH family [Parvimonas sp. KA00067]